MAYTPSTPYAIGRDGAFVDTFTKSIEVGLDDVKDVSSVSYKANPYTPRGISRTFEGDKYTAAKIKQFPEDLFSNRGIYGGNWVAFYINVVEGSKLIKDGLATTTTNDTPSMRSNIDPSGSLVVNAWDAALAVGTAAAIAGAATGSPITGIKTGAIAGGFAAGIAAITTQNQLKRITDTIVLTVPNNLSARYSMQYTDGDTAAQANALGVLGAAGDVKDAIRKGAGSGNIEKVAKNLGNQILTGIISPIGLATGAAGGDFMSKVSGLATNPKKEQIFKGVDFRTFSFDYTFAPRNKNESEQVAAIIKLFKLHMHPEFKDSGGYLFIYPSEFDIYYYHGDTENPNLPRHTSCVLTDCNVNYTPINQLTTFADGAVTQIQLSLTFKELAILTKDQILDGF